MLANFPPLHKYAPLVIRQALSRQTLARVPETNPVTDQEDQVLQYDQVMSTKLAIAYAVALEVIFRARKQPLGGTAIDLACGPGHFSLTMLKGLQLQSLVGIDLSQPMITTANANARQSGLSDATFRVGDVTNLTDVADSSYSMSTFMDAAHHMPNLETVRGILSEMDRITCEDGLIVVMDLVRFRSQAVTERYIDLVAHDYEERGLSKFREDFRQSMYAAWLPEELASAVPSESKRSWFHLIPYGLPTIQFVVGVPKNQSKCFLRHVPKFNSLVPKLAPSLRADWHAMRHSLLYRAANAVRL